MAYILDRLSETEKAKFQDSTVLVTGSGGFLGYYFLHFFAAYADELGIQKIISLENFLTGTKGWMDALAANTPKLELHEFNVITDDVADIPGAAEADLIIHAASIASPTFYRQYPLETIDANVTGLRRLLDFYVQRDIKGFLFFSSSEIYGDPDPACIPTPEDYRGNVACMGPRACYDEAKRFGETLCYTFAQQFGMPVSIARPFNNYGPGMSVNDRRLPADFAKAVTEGRDIVILSDGKPTRTFCYIADAITGYLKVMLYGKLDAFNIGMDRPECSVRQFATYFVEQAREVFDYQGEVRYEQSPDKDYLTDNPNRRCPDLTKARTVLGYEPKILVDQGIGRYLRFLKFAQSSTTIPS